MGKEPIFPKKIEKIPLSSSFWKKSSKTFLNDSFLYFEYMQTKSFEQSNPKKILIFSLSAGNANRKFSIVSSMELLILIL